MPRRKPRPGRPPSDDPRDRLLTIRVTAGELAAYHRAAKRAGAKTSDYVRAAVNRYITLMEAPGTDG